MKRMEWLAAGFLVMVGMSCLTLSVGRFALFPSFQDYLHTFFVICLWTGVPGLIGFLVYYLFL